MRRKCGALNQCKDQPRFRQKKTEERAMAAAGSGISNNMQDLLPEPGAAAEELFLTVS